MRILLTNDDGYHAEGLQELAKQLGTVHEVWVIAPELEQSGCSHSLTMRRPLRSEKMGERRYKIDGSPSDTVYVALHAIMPEKPDIIISGINAGPNMGDDVTYSGTVGAAMEGTIQGIPSIAISVVAWRDQNWKTACIVAQTIAEKVAEEGLPPRTLLNVNVPNGMAPEAIEYAWTIQGWRDYAQNVDVRRDPRGRKYYWVGGDGLGKRPVKNSDIEAVDNGYVSVTPITLDMTDYENLPTFKDWSFNK